MKKFNEYLDVIRNLSEEFLKDLSDEETQSLKQQIEVLVQEDKSDAEILEELGKRADGKPYSQYMHSIKPLINEARIAKHGMKTV